MKIVIDAIMDWLVDIGFPLLFISTIAAAVIGAPVVIYLYATAEKITLIKADWECTGMERRQSTTIVNSGNIGIPVTSEYKHCLQWTEIDR